MRFLLALLLSLPLASCAWLERHEIEVCVEYKGKHVCVTRHAGVWGFLASEGGKLSALTPADEAAIREKVEGR